MKQSNAPTDILRTIFDYLKKRESGLDSSFKRCLVDEIDENGTIVKTSDYAIRIALVRNGVPGIEIEIRGDVVAADGTKTSQWTNSDWKNLVEENASSRIKIVQQKISDKGSTVVVATLLLLTDWTVWKKEPPTIELENIWKEYLNVLQKLREMHLSR